MCVILSLSLIGSTNTHTHTHATVSFVTQPRLTHIVCLHAYKRESVCVFVHLDQKPTPRKYMNTHTLLTAQAPFHTPLRSETCQTASPALASVFQLKHAHDGAAVLAELVKVT